MNQQKSLLLFGGRICQELSRQPFLSKDYQVTYIDSLLNTQHYPDAVLPKEIGTDIRPDLLVIDFQAVIEECISNTCPFTYCRTGKKVGKWQIQEDIHTIEIKAGSCWKALVCCQYCRSRQHEHCFVSKVNVSM